MKPNIFEISTKELTQDAFITWLLQWADSQNEQYDSKLHDCGVNFVRYLLRKQIAEDIIVKRVEADRQWEKIDIWADVNERYFIIIEDKTFTSEHSNQLETYKKISQDWCNKNNRKLICIYLKTGTEALASLRVISEKGFSIVERSDLIKFFSHYSISNAIYVDFVEKINNLEKAEEAFETKKIGDWDWNCWTGFYHFLDSKLEITDWKYVSNPAGGFLGIWWNFLEWEDYYVYLQIEQGNLCFKIGEVYEDNKNVRNRWHNILMEKAKQSGLKEIVKPARFGNGTYMTVGIIGSKYWLGKNTDVLNKENVIKKLEEYGQFLIYVVGLQTAMV
jgi:hypothetical protein